jgi:putative ABC transport system ATP-binding protein
METKKNLIEAKGIDLLCEKVSKRGGLALGDVNFRINAGEFVIFFGPLDSGRLQMLRLLAGLSKPIKGEIITNSKSVFVPDSIGLISTLSVLDNVALPLIFKGVPKKLRYKMAAEMLVKVGMDGKMYEFPQKISKKEQQLATIARSLIDKPEIIFLDNPVKKLGLKSSKIVFDILYNLNLKEKKTIVVATDDSELFCYADRILFLKGGRIIKEGINTKKPKLFDVLNKKFLKENNLNFARALTDYFLSLEDFHLKNRLKELFLKRFENKLSDGSLEDLLRRPVRDGGIGLSEEKAQEALRRTALIFLERDILEKEQKKESVDIGELRKRVLVKYSKKLSIIQIERLEEVIERFLVKIINDEQFKKILTLPEIQGGIGFTTREAKKMLLKLSSFFKK